MPALAIFILLFAGAARYVPTAAIVVAGSAALYGLDAVLPLRPQPGPFWTEAREELARKLLDSYGYIWRLW